ncbi:MAG: hypothetical protein GAK40_00304 [Burkholderia plantarii]|nr:MAG: hypothetical protein GAK40_00304 [Burkholderia plantarii]
MSRASEGLLAEHFREKTEAPSISNREAYGDDPPYDSRTTNRDKWSSPLPCCCRWTRSRS